ncbi:hypothetical protein C6495_10415 [Candidatus Poribacteria bacterium]|nr:MAG: hypothetical protein C6495_10415 [Candidatus Poribacteria bacterium]
MKLGILFILVLSLFHTAAFGDMSVTDLEKIRDITKESETRVRTELTAVEKRLKEEIVASEERSKEFTSHETAKVGISVNAVKEQLNWNFLLVLALIGLFGVILGRPYLQQRKNEREQAEKIAAQQREIEELQKAKIAQQRQLEAMQKELEALKQNQKPSA